MPTREQPRSYTVSARDKAPLLGFMLHALRDAGCRIIHEPAPDHAPFRITFETPDGERMGILAYAFLANTRLTAKRPVDEHRFQVKYGTKDGKLHELWQDPYGLYVTLFVGIDPELGIFVAADPVLHSPTRFFISVEYKQRHVDEIQQKGWHAWEREHRRPSADPVEVLVGGKASAFLRYIRFEREALREDQGHRQLLAERAVIPVRQLPSGPVLGPTPSPTHLHALTKELELSEKDVLDLIAKTRRLKMAVRGWVAEEHLARQLREVPGVTECERPDEEGGPDVRLRYRGSAPLRIECKNVLRQMTSAGLARIDFQRTRASKNDPCSRYYARTDFDIVAACMHAVSERWEFRFAPVGLLDALGPKCPGKLANTVKVDGRWDARIENVLASVVNA